MLRNYLAAALRNLARNRLYSGISIFALAIGLCAALVMGLVVRSELSYDRFIPGYERIYLAASALTPAGHPTQYDTGSPSWIAALMKLQIGGIEAVARLGEQEVLLRRGATEATERIYWADPNAFGLLGLPMAAGNAATALERPDGIVMSRSAARKYFGRDDPRGEAILLDGTHPMVVTAVLEDLPANGTHLGAGIFASGLATHSLLSQLDRDPVNVPNSGSVSITVRTYLRVAPGVQVERLGEPISKLTDSVWADRPPGLGYTLKLLRIDRVHLFPGLNPGIASRLAMGAAIGALLLFIACVVYVNLATARSARRAVEVALRKAAGAPRSALILQFLGESLIYVAVASCLAMALAELLLPHVNAFLDTGAVLHPERDPLLLLWIGLGALLLGTASGLYPALIISAFRPGVELARGRTRSGGTAARQLLVTLQFAILVALLIGAAVVHRQRAYALGDALRMDTDQILLIRAVCNGAFVTELRALPGVTGASCSTGALLTSDVFGNYRLKDGSSLPLFEVGLEPGIFALYGLKPVAGRFFPLPNDVAAANGPVSRYVLNESAAKRMGFASPSAAIGQALPLSQNPGNVSKSSGSSEIIGIAPDFAFEAVGRRIEPTIYYRIADARSYDLISVRLSGRRIPETLSAIDALWDRMGLQVADALSARSSEASSRKPIDRFFLDDYLQTLHLAMLRQAQVLGTFSCVAVLLACLGMAGLAGAATERRTREIGIRKAMGANDGHVVQLLLWQFAKPVLWASPLAWPAAAFLMNGWLEGFAYHVGLQLWVFVAASGVALAVALLTVGVHTLFVARAKPVEALRHE